MLQRFIRCTGYVAVAVSLVCLAELILTIFTILGGWFTSQSTTSFNELVIWTVGLGAGSFMSFLTVILDIKLEDRKWRKENKKSYSESMSQNDKE